MKRWLITCAEHAPYELVPGEATLVGRSARTADFVVPVATMGRVAASFTWRGGAWWVRDAGSTGGTFLRGERVNGAALDDGAVVTVGAVDITLSSFYADPLDDVIECGDWIAYGRRRPFEHGRWSAFRRGDGSERGLLVLGGDADDLPDSVARGSSWYVRPAASGMPLALFAEAIAAAPADAIAFGGFVLEKIARVPPPVDASDLVVTWDGSLMRLPPRRMHASPHDDVSPLFPMTTFARPEGESFGFPPARLSALLRALCEDEWRAEVELREQLEALNEEGVRWLLERNQRTP